MNAGATRLKINSAHITLYFQKPQTTSIPIFSNGILYAKREPKQCGFPSFKISKLQMKQDQISAKKGQYTTTTKMLSGLGEGLEENSALRLIHRLEKRTINPFKTKFEPCGYIVLIFICLKLLKHKKIPKHHTYQTMITNWSSEKPNDLQQA